jgi:hypothetical protein
MNGYSEPENDKTLKFGNESIPGVLEHCLSWFSVKERPNKAFFNLNIYLIETVIL